MGQMKQLEIEYHEKLGFKQSTFDALQRYVEHRIPTGDFLYAVLTDSLSGAIGHADEENLRDIVAIVRYVYCHIPSKCWGSPAKYKEWIDGKEAL